jgi:hypothetical protein
MKYTITTKHQLVRWNIPWGDRLRIALCVLLGWPFHVDGDFTISGEGDVL